MKTNNKRAPKKANISIRRKITIYYRRVLITMQLVIVVLVLAFLFTPIFDGYKKQLKAYSDNWLASYGFILKEVVIEGQRYAPPKEVIDALGADKGAPLFSINLKGVKDKLEENIWIKAASVERKIPSTIYIAILERTPIAVWQFQQKLYLIDSEGNRIAPFDGRSFEDLVHVVGQDANIYAANLLEDLSKHPGLSSRIISAVRYGERRWNLNFETNMTVKMPENNFLEAYEYLHLLDKKKKLFDQGYKMLDLRDKDKFYFEKY